MACRLLVILLVAIVVNLPSNLNASTAPGADDETDYCTISDIRMCNASTADALCCSRLQDSVWKMETSR